MDFSIIIPFYNEEENVQPVLRGVSKILDQKQVNYEIIAVNNNSKDQTGNLIKELMQANPKIRYVFVKAPGYGNAVRGGLNSARGKWIGWMDGDLQIAPVVIWQVVKKIREENSIFCLAERRVRFDGPSRALFTRLYRFFIFLLFKQWFFDVNGKPKLFRRSWYQKIKTVSNGWFFDTELVGMYFKTAGAAKIPKIPITFYPRKKGKSSVGMKTIYQLFKEIVHFIGL